MNHLYFVIRGTVEVLSGDVIMAILGEYYYIELFRPRALEVESITSILTEFL